MSAGDQLPHCCKCNGNHYGGCVQATFVLGKRGKPMPYPVDPMELDKIEYGQEKFHAGYQAGLARAKKLCVPTIEKWLSDHPVNQFDWHQGAENAALTIQAEIEKEIKK